jgi:hypothetical protein
LRQCLPVGRNWKTPWRRWVKSWSVTLRNELFSGLPVRFRGLLGFASRGGLALPALGFFGGFFWLVGFLDGDVVGSLRAGSCWRLVFKVLVVLLPVAGISDWGSDSLRLRFLVPGCLSRGLCPSWSSCFARGSEEAAETSLGVADMSVRATAALRGLAVGWRFFGLGLRFSC